MQFQAWYSKPQVLRQSCHKSHLCGFSSGTKLSARPDSILSSLRHAISSPSAPWPFGVYAKPKCCSSDNSACRQGRHPAAFSPLSQDVSSFDIQREEDTKLMVFCKIMNSDAKTPLCGKAGLEPTVVLLRLGLFAPCILFCADWHQISIAKLQTCIFTIPCDQTSPPAHPFLQIIYEGTEEHKVEQRSHEGHHWPHGESREGPFFREPDGNLFPWRRESWGGTLLLSTTTWKEVVVRQVLVSSPR